ncbi:MAG: hypothetical protein GY861_21920 [bacterium]|nr:hypothetical protein [bacterium]
MEIGLKEFRREMLHNILLGALIGSEVINGLQLVLECLLYCGYDKTEVLNELAALSNSTGKYPGLKKSTLDFAIKVVESFNYLIGK